MTDRTVLVRLRAENSDFVRGMGTAAAAVAALRKDIDTTNDRTAWLAQGFAAIGPTLAPIGAAAAGLAAGLATQMGVAALAAGTAVLAFQGVGTALGAVNDYQLKPTAEGLAKVRAEFAKLGPDGADFVLFLDSVGPKFHGLQLAARAGMFPGVEEGITSLMDMLPRLKSIVTEVSEGMGQLAASSGSGLAGDGYAESSST